jgi:hypothetical protein
MSQSSFTKLHCLFRQMGNKSSLFETQQGCRHTRFISDVDPSWQAIRLESPSNIATITEHSVHHSQLIGLEVCSIVYESFR